MTDSKEHRGWIGKLFGGRRTRAERPAPARPAGEDPRAWARPEELVDLSSLPPHVAEDMVATAALIDEADRAREHGHREQAEELLRAAVRSTVDPYRQLAEERLGTLLSENGEVEEAIALWLRAAEGPDPGLRQAVGVHLGSIAFTDAAFLVRADPATVLALLPGAWGAGRLGAAVYQASAHRHRDAPAAVRRHLLALDAARYGDLDLAARIAAVPVPDEPPSRRRVEWASGAQLGGCRWSTPGHADGVSAVAAGTVTVDGRPVVVTGGDDGTVRLWDLATGEPVGEPLADHTGPVLAVATADLDGRPVAVSAGTDKAVRVWDLGTRRLLHAPLTGHTGWVTGAATTTLRDRPVAVTCGHDQSVRVWDLATGEPAGAPMGEPAGPGSAYPHRLAAVVTTVLDRRPVAVTGDFEGTIRIWDLAKGRRLRAPLVTGTGAVEALATVSAGGRPTLVVGGSDGTATLWDLASGAQAGERLAGSAPWPQAVAAVTSGAGPVVVTGDTTGMVRLWDPATGRQTAQAFAGPLGRVRTLAASTADGRPVVLVGTGDGRVHRWDPDTEGPVGRPLPGHGDTVTSVTTIGTDGDTLVVSSAWDGTARLWDLATGAEAGTPFTGSGEPVHGTAAAVVDGRPVVVVAEGGETARLWDPVTAAEAGALDHDADVHAVATTTLDGRPVAVTGSADGLVRIWDLGTGEDLHGPLAGHESGVIAAAVTVLDGRPVAVTADEDTVRLWDPAAGTPIGPQITVAPPAGPGPAADPEDEAPPAVELLATAVVDGRPVLAVGCEDGLVHLRDLTTRAPIGGPVHAAGLTAMATARIDDRPALVTGGDDGVVRTWDLTTLTRSGPDLVLPFPVEALAVAPDGRLVVGFGREVGVFGPADPA
ncbi:WD40 repeat domain-containing protein [Streptomyces misionensis]|uniref:WD40 repeat domain-containing protein n=1 Tax=Streptomyces misionensis TaxID=67331 RepID=A0A5C6JYP6_9ACTN|nr:WD40 repeat domain-containing protein [Streptomyces misionensis]TWV53854.1 WD40 repeat domain-containing protein [Streptomyces misionensis]